MSLKLLNNLKNRVTGSSAKRAVLKSLCEFYNDDSGQCNPSLTKLEADTELNRKTIINSLDQLEKMGVIQKILLRGQTTQYVIRLEKLPQKDTDLVEIPVPKTVVPKNTPVPNSVLPKTVLPQKQVVPKTETTSTKNGTEVVPKTVLKTERNIKETLNNQIVGDMVQETPPSIPEKKRKAITHHFDLPSLPDDWKVYCEQVRPELDPNRVFLHFSFYFKSGNGNGKVRSDKGWNQSWQNWVRRETNNLTLKPNTPFNNGVKQISTRPPLEDFSDRNYPKGVVYLGRNK